MALPTLPSSWTHKHQHVEKQMMRMREQQKRFREQWENATNYYKDQTISNRIRTNLMSEGAYKKSMETYSSLDERNRKLAALHRRREKLRELLQKERNAQEAELRGLSVGNYSRLQDMQERTEELKSAREEKRKELATEKLYQHWRENNEHLRKVESDLHQQHVREAWGDQTERRIREKDAAAASDRKFANEYEEARVRGMERMRRKEEERVREEVERAKMLKQQMADLKRREEAAALLKREEEQIRREEWELEKVQEERRKMAEQRKKTELQRFLHHQFRAQLRRRAQQIQEELEFDREILRRLEEEEQRSKEQQTARQMKAKEDVQWMKEVLEQQLKLEAKREAELDLVYREEGRRVWEQREKEWERERIARQKLMAEVLGERSGQIQERAERNRRRQEELLREREELVEVMEQEQQTARMSKEEEEKRKKMINDELHGQMTERKHEIQTRREQEEQEQERVKRNEQDYDAIMRDEEERMRQMGF
uniref:Trichoplein keratin filament-binding protein n=1 Tax=Ciona savignyi TaxID=51511 RepID=H2YXB5_CIOSA